MSLKQLHEERRNEIEQQSSLIERQSSLIERQRSEIELLKEQIGKLSGDARRFQEENRHLKEVGRNQDMTIIDLEREVQNLNGLVPRCEELEAEIIHLKKAIEENMGQNSDHEQIKENAPERPCAAQGGDFSGMGGKKYVYDKKERILSNPRVRKWLVRVAAAVFVVCVINGIRMGVQLAALEDKMDEYQTYDWYVCSSSLPIYVYDYDDATGEYYLPVLFARHIENSRGVQVIDIGEEYVLVQAAGNQGYITRTDFDMCFTKVSLGL